MGDPKDNDIENPDEVPVSPDGMNEDSSGAGTSTNTSTMTERHFRNKVGPLAGINITLGSGLWRLGITFRNFQEGEILCTTVKMPTYNTKNRLN